MKKMIPLLAVLILSTSLVYGINIKSESASFLGQAIDFSIEAKPSELNTFVLVLPDDANLVDWNFNKVKYDYSYEARGGQIIHTWDNLSYSKYLSFNAKISFNKPGEREFLIFYKGANESMVRKKVYVSDKSLCGNGLCDKNEEYTCPQDCKKFELPTIPKWVWIVLIVVLILVLVLAYVKLRFWY